MLRNLIIAAMAMATGLFVSGAAVSQTADAFPPAQEGICDQLAGGSPGLYGLCVAYCEAQDLDEMFQEIKAGGNPGERILANYRKKMKMGDPDMPCIVSSPGACPCFNITICDPVDFICQLDVLNVSEVFTGRTCTFTQLCNNSATPSRTAQDTCNDFVGGVFESRQVSVAVSENGAPGTCLARSNTSGEGISDNVFTGLILDFDTSVRCLEEINTYDGNGPLDGNLDGNAGGMCFLANP